MKLIFLMVLAMASEIPEGGVAWKPICSQVKMEDWMTSYGACKDAFALKARQGDAQVAAAEKICRCVADGFVQKPSCEKLEELNKKPQARAELSKRLAADCGKLR